MALLALVGVILTGVILCACDDPPGMFATPTPTPCDVDFRDLVPMGWVPVSHFVVKTGGLPPESQCLVLYRLGAQLDPQKASPIEGVVYRRDHGEPPRSILAYPLRLPERFYLGEHNLNVYTGTLITGTRWPQVVVEDWDPAGITVGVSLFQWYDLDYEDPFAPYNPNRMGYRLVGYFLGEGGIQVGQNVITVAERIAETRSRLAYRKVYTPKSNGKSWSYSLSESSFKRVNLDTMEMIALVECTKPDAACYPEKTVLDFYQYFNDEGALKGLMIPEALQALKDRKLKYGCASNRDDVERALAQNIKILGTNDNPLITVGGQCKLKGNPVKTTMTPVTWALERNKEGKWLLQSSR